MTTQVPFVWALGTARVDCTSINGNSDNFASLLSFLSLCDRDFDLVRCDSCRTAALC